MDDVQLQLAQKRIPKCAGVALCGLDTDKNFAVLKGQYVSRTRLPEKLSMQERHPPVGNQPNRNFARLAQISLFSLLQLQRMLHRFGRELFERGNIDPSFPLQVAHVDFRNCHSEGVKNSWSLPRGETKAIIRDVSLRST